MLVLPPPPPPPGNAEAQNRQGLLGKTQPGSSTISLKSNFSFSTFSKGDLHSCASGRKSKKVGPSLRAQQTYKVHYWTEMTDLAWVFWNIKPLTAMAKEWHRHQQTMDFLEGCSRDPLGTGRPQTPHCSQVFSLFAEPSLLLGCFSRSCNLSVSINIITSLRWLGMTHLSR